MAESFAFDIAHSLLGKLASYAYVEASLAYGVYDDLQLFKDTLSIVTGVLLDAENKKDQNQGLKEWLRQIQNICYDAEDVFDGFEFQHKKKQVVKASGSMKMKVSNFFSSSNPIVFRFKMAHQIKNIKERLDKVAADGNKFGLAKIDVGPELVLSKRETTHSHVDASSVIGRDNEREEIIKLLGDDGDQRFCVIPIVAIGGLGKTTLAKLVFNDKRIDELFPLKMWVCVSDDFDIRQIIIKIINSASASTFAPVSAQPSVALAHQENINNLDIEELQSRLRHKLFGQKFLLVLDDIWNEDRAKWIELMDLIKNDATGNKIIVTTRSNSIASMMGTISSYVLDGLSPEDCLSLFVKWAFKEGEAIKHSNLVEIGKEIVKKCAGVPLAVKSLGSALLLKYDLNKWIFVRDSEIWNLEQKKYDILPALKLSYDEMSFYLRKCFAFFSLYPKDHTFYGAEVIPLWVALGFVKSQTGSKRLNDIAREYIDELSSRSFLQDFVDYGDDVVFKVHDLIHDLAMFVAKEEFVAINSHTRNIPEQVRHLSVVENNNSLKNVLFPKTKSLKTILFPIQDVGLDNQILLDTWISRYKYLRYLDLSDSCFETLPNSISKLEHLRVLDLENCKIRILPNSICKLYNLQVLRLHGCRELEILPRGLGRLISLRELLITTKQSVLSLTEFANLNHLQDLTFDMCENMKLIFNEAQQLTSLEALCVQSCGSIESLPLFMFPNLRSLAIADCEMINLSLYNENPIQRLTINHLTIGELTGLVTLPEWIECLVDTLETLEIYKHPNLKSLPECLTTMTHLKRLYIGDCPQLLSFPTDMHRLTALEDLEIFGCPELCRKYQPQSGEYWPMIAHIKKTFIGEPSGAVEE